MDLSSIFTPRPWLTPDLRGFKGSRVERNQSFDGDADHGDRRTRRGTGSLSPSDHLGGGHGAGRQLRRPSFDASDGTGGGGKASRNRRDPPILTSILLRLDECLPEYHKELLSNGPPRVWNAARAAKVLEDGMYLESGSALEATDRQGIIAPRSSPSRKVQSSLTAHALESEWEKLVSPLTLLSGAEALYGGLEHVASYDVPSQNKSDNFTHLERRRSIIQTPERLKLKPDRAPEAKNLPIAAERVWSMYAKVRVDLVTVREILCDPLLRSSDISDPLRGKGASNVESRKAAESLSTYISTLAKLCDARQALICLHTDLVFHSKRSAIRIDENKITNGGLLNLAERCDSIATSLLEPEDGQSNHLRLEVTRHETLATAAALRAMNHIKTCSFFETIVHMKHLKNFLGPSSPFYSSEGSPSSIEVWLRSVLNGLQSRMQMFFDRIETYAHSNYGFRKNIFAEDKGQDVTAASGLPLSPESSTSPQHINTSSSHSVDRKFLIENVDNDVMDLIYRHTDKSRPPLAVAIIFDAPNCADGAFERGFVCETIASEKNNAEEDLWRSYPAIYLRSSLRSGNPDFEQTAKTGGGSGSRRGQQKGSKGMSMAGLSRVLSNAGEAASQSISGIKRPSYGGNTSRSSLVSATSDLSIGVETVGSLGPSPLVKACEYWPANAEKSWPRCQWPTIIKSLTKEPKEPPFLPTVASSDHLDFPPRPLLAVRSSVVSHSVKINEKMWLAVIFEEEDNTRLLRGTKGLPNDEIYLFLSKVHSKLSLHSLLDSETITFARDTAQGLALNPMPTPSPKKSIDNMVWQDGETREYLDTLKESFGLKPSPLLAPFRKPYQKRNIRSGGTRTRNKSKLTSFAVEHNLEKYDESAVSFFLGSEMRRHF